MNFISLILPLSPPLHAIQEKDPMKAIHLKQFPTIALRGARSFLTVQRLWEDRPELRPQISQALKRFSRAINEVVSPRHP